MSWHHQDLEHKFGPKLSFIFSGTESLRSADEEDLAVIKKAIKNCKMGKQGFIDTSEWGSKTYVNVMETVLTFLINCKDSEGKCVFHKYKLPQYDEDQGVKGMNTAEWEDVYINYKAQRVINMNNIIKHLINFNPMLVFGAKGRKDPKRNVYYINDGQHGSILLGIVGVKDLPIIYVESDKESVDFDHFLAFNVDNYDTEDYDKHRNKVQRAKRMAEETMVASIYPTDKRDYYANKLFETHNVTLVPKAKKSIGSGESTHVKKLLTLYEEYRKNKVFERAVTVVRRAWQAHGVPQEPVWGLCELIKAQNGMKDREWDKMEDVLVQSLFNKWSTGPTAVWDEVRTVLSKLNKMPEYKDKPETNTSNRGKMIAQAMVDVVHKWDEVLQNPANGNQKGHGVKLDPIYPDAMSDSPLEYPDGFPTQNMEFAQ